MLNQISVKTQVTMSSLEIAKLTGKNHANVMRDIREMLEKLSNPELGSQNYLQNQVVGGAFRFEGTYLDASNRQSKCYNLPRRETEILITGYDVVRRAKVIDRWMELEAKVRQPVQPQLQVSELQLARDILDSAITLKLSREDLFAILGKQLPEPKVEVIHEHRIITRGVVAKEAPLTQQEENDRIVTKMWGITEDTKFYDDDEWDY